MWINTQFKFMILLTPRCATTTILHLMRLIDKSGTGIYMNEHYHNRLDEAPLDNTIQEYTVFITDRDLWGWAISCYSNFANNWPEHAKELTFEKFVENKGIDTRPIGAWDWFAHSPHNMATSHKEGKPKEIIYVNYNNLMNELFIPLHKRYRIPLPKMTKLNASEKIKLEFTKEEKERLLKLIEEECFPSN